MMPDLLRISKKMIIAACIAVMPLSAGAAFFETQCMRDANAYATSYGTVRGTPAWSVLYYQFMDENCPGGAYDWE